MSLPVETLLSLPGAHPYLPLFHHLAAADRALFRLVNGAWTNPLLDRAMPALSTFGNLGAVWLGLLGAIAAFGKKTGQRLWRGWRQRGRSAGVSWPEPGRLPSSWTRSPTRRRRFVGPPQVRR